MDTNIIPLGESALQQILDHVIANGDEAETYYLEVKSDLRVGSKEGAAKIAKFLLGAANRDPIQAARHFHGYAVLVIGARKDVAEGVARGAEPHEIEDKLQPYLGAKFPAFELGRIPVDEEREVLFIVAPPPQDGQDMFPCHENFHGEERKNNLDDGAIYVRGQSNTRKARSGEILKLLARGKRVGKAPIELTIDPIGAVHRVSHLPELMETLYAWEEQKYTEHTAAPQVRPEVQAYIARAWGVLGQPATPEQRANTLAKWRTNKEKNIANGCEHFLGAALEGLGLRITSPNRYIEQPHLVIIFQDCMVVDHLDREDADLDKVLEPIVRNSSLYPSTGVELLRPNLMNDSVDWQNSGENAEVHFTPKDFRPNTPRIFDQDDYVIVARDNNMEHITATWELTEAGNDDVTSGTFVVPVSDTVDAAGLFQDIFQR